MRSESRVRILPRLQELRRAGFVWRRHASPLSALRSLRHYRRRSRGAPGSRPYSQDRRPDPGDRADQASYSFTVIRERDVPAASALENWRVEKAYLRDAFCAPLTRTELSVTDLFAGIFGHHTRMMKAALLLRNALGAPFGLAAHAPTELLKPSFRACYQVGEKLGRWPIFHLSADEVIAGADGPHLDFRVSVLRASGRLTVSTVCTVNNRFGRPYLSVVRPFHRYGVSALLRQAVQAGRV